MRIKAIIVMAAVMRGPLFVPTKIRCFTDFNTRSQKDNISRIGLINDESTGLAIVLYTPTAQYLHYTICSKRKS